MTTSYTIHGLLCNRKVSINLLIKLIKSRDINEKCLKQRKTYLLLSSGRSFSERLFKKEKEVEKNQKYSHNHPYEHSSCRLRFHIGPSKIHRYSTTSEQNKRNEKSECKFMKQRQY